MPQFCSVFGCSNRSNREKGKGYYRVPKVIAHKGEKWKKLTEQRRKKWIANLRLLTGGAETANGRVCGDHFVKGCPSALADHTESVDWAPTVKLGYQRTELKSASSVKRGKRMRQKEDLQDLLECAEAILDLQQTPASPVMSPEPTAESSEQNQPAVNTHSRGISGHQGHADAGCQTELTMDDLKKMEDVLRQNTTELVDLRAKALDTQFLQESFEKNEDKLRFYTGLPNFLVLMQVFELCKPYISCGHMASLSKFEQLIFVLMRLRLDLPLKDLAFRFKISQATASRLWYKVIDILHERLKFQIKWPKRPVLQATMPVVSDKQITIESGLPKQLLPGDIVLADCGFNIGDGVAEIIKTVNFRIHDENVMGSVRRKYQILQSRSMPTENTTKSSDALRLIDKIEVICCVLSNLSESVAPSVEQGGGGTGTGT